MNVSTFLLALCVLLVQGLLSGVGLLLQRQGDVGLEPAVVRNFNLRIRAWWMITSLVAAAFLLGSGSTTFFFFCLAFWALREFITVTPTRKADHRALFWVFFLFTPLQFVLVWLGNYGLYSVLIPVYAMLFIPIRSAISGDYRRFLERTAKIQAGLMVCVYCLSHVPALLTLDFAAPVETTAIDGTQVDSIEDAEPTGTPPRPANYSLLLFLVVIVQVADLSQFCLNKVIGKNIIAAEVSPSRTWEGAIGGAAVTALAGAGLYAITPFEAWQSGAMAFVAAVMAYGGGLTMSAIKRDRGVNDYGTLVEGHGGVLDRIDSLCFAAPVFFHITRYFFTA